MKTSTKNTAIVDTTDPTTPPAPPRVPPPLAQLHVHHPPASRTAARTPVTDATDSAEIYAKT
jgi:hypothetical protein